MASLTSFAPRRRLSAAEACLLLAAIALACVRLTPAFSAAVAPRVSLGSDFKASEYGATWSVDPEAEHADTENSCSVAWRCALAVGMLGIVARGSSSLSGRQARKTVTEMAALPKPFVLRLPGAAQPAAGLCGFSSRVGACREPALLSRQAEGSDGWVRRDVLLEIETEMQQLWEANAAYEVDAPEPGSEQPKFFVTFPYPYMNGKLHLGHAFSLTKAEFAARFNQLDGKRVLWPFSFHCTGMPIAAAAMKLEKELAAGAEEEEQEEPELVAAGESSAETQVGVFKGSKSKAVAKTGGLGQADIMRAMNIAEDEIPNFTDPYHWLKFFPPLAVADLKRLGVAVDWRRSFITTDVNPYYDAFIQWQFKKLREKYLGSGFRASIYSIATGQPCADHDRAEGEGVNPIEYTLIKMKIKEVPEDWASAVGSQDVYLVAATLRPETMYGQTNCFVLPEGDYGLFQMNDGQIFVCSKRSALNMCYQGLGVVAEDGPNKGEPVCLMETTGQNLVGLPLKAPLASYDTIYVLPMLTISMGKGTGIVTSVPAESPDDYACLNDWKTRENWREQYGVKEEWCQPFDVVEILEIPDSEFGTASAPYICEKLKIKSHKEKPKLEEAKKEVYQKGFYSGVLTVGPYAGQKVMDVKPLIQDSLIESGDAARYFEPEGRVVARSGDECIVALCDQWYLTYSDKGWTERVRSHVKNDFRAYNTSCEKSIDYAVGWLGDWACSRTFGLGSKLPWDEKWLIESLSDSTIYMAYYTIAHLVQGGNVEGTDVSSGITPEQLTEDVFDYIFLDADLPASTSISKESLDKMKNEFNYWYPMDLRCSGKDLIRNHLTMSLFNHAAVWEDPKMWPRSFFCNGHIMVDSEKMSKSTGNFITLEESIKTYSADATRIACADSGDGLEDANFSRESAGRAIQRLTQWKAWAEDIVKRMPDFRSAEHSLLDGIFLNEINKCVDNCYAGYANMVYSEALREGLFDMDNLRSQYSILTGGDMHKDVLEKFLAVQVLILSPIAPHFCEHMWRSVLGRDTLVVKEKWPKPETPVDPVVSQKYTLIQETFRSFRLELDRLLSPKKKKKKGGNDDPPPKPTHAVVFVARSYKTYQQDILKLLQQVELNEENEPADPAFMKSLKDAEVFKSMDKKSAKDAMSFAAFMMRTEVKSRGPEALDLELPFDEAALLNELLEPMKRQLGLAQIEIVDASIEEHPHSDPQKQAAAGPGTPQIVFYVVEPEPA